MAKEPDDLVLRILREIRDEQRQQGADLKHLKKRVDELFQTSTFALGLSANAHMRHEVITTDIDELKSSVAELKSRVAELVKQR